VPVAVAGLVVWGAFVLFGAGGDDEAAPSVTIEDEGAGDGFDRSSTTEPRRHPARPVATTSTTLAGLAGAPVLGQPTGLVVALNDDRGSLLVDLDTGAVERRDGHVVGARPERLLTSLSDGSIEALSAPFLGIQGIEVPVPDEAYPERAWPVAGGYWVLSFSPESSSRVQFVSSSGEVREGPDLSAMSWPAGTTDDHLVLRAPGGTYLVDGDGDVEHLSGGDPIAVSGDVVVVNQCDASLSCGVVAHDVGSGRTQALDLEIRDGTIVAVASDGRVATLDQYLEPYQVAVDGRPVLQIDQGSGGIAWSTDSRWLFVLAGEGQLRILDMAGGRGTFEVDLSPWRATQAWEIFVVSKLDV
jgi:hypothetical protein